MIKVFVLTIILGSGNTSNPLHAVKYYYPNSASCQVAASQWKSRKFNTNQSSTKVSDAFCDLSYLPANTIPE